jgi:hypothetical protein
MLFSQSYIIYLIEPLSVFCVMPFFYVKYVPGIVFFGIQFHIFFWGSILSLIWAIYSLVCLFESQVCVGWSAPWCFCTCLLLGQSFSTNFCDHFSMLSCVPFCMCVIYLLECLLAFHFNNAF